MAHSTKETLSIIWCDNGTTDGKFTEGLVYTIIHAHTVGVPVNNAIRVQGNQIARQRQAAIEMWEKVGTDWALWIDSDIDCNQNFRRSFCLFYCLELIPLLFVGSAVDKSRSLFRFFFRCHSCSISRFTSNQYFLASSLFFASL